MTDPLRTPINGSQRLPMGQAANFKIFLLVLASALVIGMLLYSQRLTDQLLARERQVVDLYAKSYEYITSEKSSSGDLSFLFDEVIQTVDFPVILTDTNNVLLYQINLKLDPSISAQDSVRYFSARLAAMDRENKPIRIAYHGTVLNYVHYGESDLIAQLRWLPLIEIGLGAVFVLVAYLGFSNIKRSEQSNIWVGMAKETAHQLGTPLSSIMGWLERVREEAGNNPRLLQDMREMQSDVERLIKVAARFSKIGSTPDFATEDVAAVIRGVVDYISKRIPKSGRTIEITITPPGEFPAQINRELFEWVIENLMKNALDAMEEKTGKITFMLSRSGAKTIIDVHDTGKGIEPKHHKDVFRPGYSTKRRGWGLGLSLSKRIIEDYHKGQLYVKQSAPGAGTTFRIRLSK